MFLQTMIAGKPNKKFWGKKIDFSPVSLHTAQPNLTQVNIYSPLILLWMMIARKLDKKFWGQNVDLGLLSSRAV